MKSVGVMAFLVGGLMLVSGCSRQPLITEGDVVSKVHEPERTWVQMVPITISNGKTVTTTIVPIVHHDDEDWIVAIEGCDASGKTRHQDFYVSQQAYEGTRVGDYYVYDDTKAEYSDPLCKKRK